MESHQTQFLFEACIAKRDHPALTRRYILDGMKRKDRGVAETTGMNPLVIGSHSVSGVLDDCQTIFAGQPVDFVHVHGDSRKMYRDDCPGF